MTLSAAAWYGEPGTGGGRPAATAPAPRALDARGLATMHHVLVQLARVDDRPRFAEACRAFGDIVWSDDLDDLAVRAPAREALAVVVDLVDRAGRSTAPTVARIRAQRPSLPIILWCDRREVGDLGSFARAGTSAVVFRDETELERRLLTALTRASDVAFQQLTDQALHRRVPAALIPVFRFCLDHAAHVPPAEVVARTVGLSARALAAQLRQAGLPPLTTLVTWSKALVASYRLERSTESVTVIARSLGFATAATLGGLLKRSTNETVRVLRTPGGFGWTLRCFERALSKGSRRA